MDYLILIGLIFDFIGILILFLYVDDFTIGAVLLNDKSRNKIKLRSRIAFGCILIGFLLQIISFF